MANTILLECNLYAKYKETYMKDMYAITPNEDSLFTPDILQSDWLRALKQGSKCLAILSQSDSNLSDLSLFEHSQPMRLHLE